MQKRAGNDMSKRKRLTVYGLEYNGQCFSFFNPIMGKGRYFVKPEDIQFEYTEADGTISRRYLRDGAWISFDADYDPVTRYVKNLKLGE